jgi:murein DD-endopeptidase MepM/ murein hydrolase activator NlpD
MNKRTMKIIGFVIAHLPVVLGLVLVLAVLSAIMAAIGQGPDDAPLLETTAAPEVEAIDEAWERLAAGCERTQYSYSCRAFLRAAYTVVFKGRTPEDGAFWDGLVAVAYAVITDETGDEENPEEKSLIAITYEPDLFERLWQLARRPADPAAEERIRDARSMFLMMDGRFQPPLNDPYLRDHVTIPFGGAGPAGAHKGITVSFGEIRALSARAMEAGTVKESGYDETFGNYVLIEHSDGMRTMYGHLYNRNVQAGQAVPAGYVLGRIGSSGLTQECALYVEVRQADGTHTDPLEWLMPG